jgi:proteasome activator subunit 4
LAAFTYLHLLPFYFRERHAKERWGFVIDDEHKLKEDDITAFVDTIKPIVFHAMYSKTGLSEAGVALQHIATLRPTSIIPTLIERMYEALGSLTEPHKLTASMHAVVSVSRSLVYPEGTDSSLEKYREGPTHVIPLLTATLPGIDPNDMRKAMVTFQFLSTFCTLVPMVDSSQAHQHYPNLTEEERVICGQTAELEDFVVQFLERCFLVIESSVFTQTREEVSVSDHHASREDSMKDIGMASTFNSILVQSSASVYDAALRKVKGFIQGRILETRIAGKIASGLCRCLCKNRPQKGLPEFLPSAIEKATLLLQNDDILKDQTIDDELKFNLLLIAEVSVQKMCSMFHLPAISHLFSAFAFLASI